MILVNVLVLESSQALESSHVVAVRVLPLCSGHNRFLGDFEYYNNVCSKCSHLGPVYTTLEKSTCHEF